MVAGCGVAEVGPLPLGEHGVAELVREYCGVALAGLFGVDGAFGDRFGQQVENALGHTDKGEDKRR